MTREEMEMSVNYSEKAAIEFSSDCIERALRKIAEEKYEFEFIGQDIVILSRDVAEKFIRAQNPFDCEEVEIVSLYDLPPNEANQIRKRHLEPAITSKHS